MLPPEALRQTKALIRHGSPEFAGRMAEEGVGFRPPDASRPEAREAFAAFAEKRRPDFSHVQLGSMGLCPKPRPG